MHISVIGAGHVGLVSSACYAELGHTVVCYDNDQQKIDSINAGQMPIFEPGLIEILVKNKENGRLLFSNKITSLINQSELIIICVGTPALTNGQADLSSVYSVAEDIGRQLTKYVVVAIKSTVPVGTARRVRKIFQKNYQGELSIASCPEFLREGSAVIDFFAPDRIVCGVESPPAEKILLSVHEKINCPKLVVRPETAEMIKYASNAFLATKVSFINEIANICESVGANVEQVAEGMGLDKRIGKQFLKAGIGYGGSCFPKDVRALQQIADRSGYVCQLLKAVIDVNNQQRWNFYEKIKKYLGSVEGEKIAIWGLSFKANTDDVRESIAIDIVEKLYEDGAILRGYDPVAMINVRAALGSKIIFCNSAAVAVQGATALVICTEWEEFQNFDLLELKKLLPSGFVFDGRNIYNCAKMKELGFNYFSIGRPEGYA